MSNLKIKNRSWIKPVVLIAVLVVFFVVARAYNLGEKLKIIQEWIAGHGPWGPVMYIGLYAMATVLAIPGSALSVTAGALFGSVVGVIVVIVGATIGASLCFLIARYFARDAVAKWMYKNEKFSKLDALTRKHGTIIVAITRLVPLFPFNLLNYGFGLTGVSFRTYVIWSFICMLPGTIQYVVGADALTTAIREGRVPWVLVGILIVVALALVLIVKRAKLHLKEKQVNNG